MAVVGERVASVGVGPNASSLPHSWTMDLLIAADLLKEIAKNISQLIADRKSSRHHYSSSPATKCECD